MGRFAIRALIVLFGGVLAAKLVEMFLMSDRGQAIVMKAGLTDLSSHQGVELAQKYARSAVNVVASTTVGVLESLDARAHGVREPGWPERVQTYAQLLLAAGTLAKTVSDFMEERRTYLGLSNI